LLGQTIGAALVALVFGYAGPSGGTSPTVAILLAAGFAALAAIASVSRLLNFVRIPRSSDSAAASASRDTATARSPP
jgi:amino acid permease